jgi:hypothetical protein
MMFFLQYDGLRVFVCINEKEELYLFYEIEQNIKLSQWMVFIITPQESKQISLKKYTLKQFLKNYKKTILIISYNYDLNAIITEKTKTIPYLPPDN